MWFRTTTIFVLVFYTISSVQCQTSLRDEVTANLTRMVQYVVHPHHAVASKEIVDYAMSIGSSPKTISEKLAYIRYIKNIALGVQEYKNQFMTTKTNLDGSTYRALDENALEDAITLKAQEYSRIREKEREANAKAASTTGTGGNTRTGTNTGTLSNTGTMSNTGTGRNTGTGSNTGTVSNIGTGITRLNQNVNTVHQQWPNQFQMDVAPAAEQTVSLMDLFRMAEMNRMI